jgi:dTDP-D-glucose 4,6-dehydratase
VVKRRASIEKARRLLGYAPKTGIKTGLKETYRWILENRDSIEKVFLSPRAELEIETPPFV